MQPNDLHPINSKEDDMEKFYTVTGPAGKPVYQYHVVDYDKAVRVASKAAQDSRDDVFILTATQVVQAPMPEAKVTAIQ